MTAREFTFFIVRRLGVLVGLLVFVSFVVFCLLYISPGNPVDVLIGIHLRTPEEVRLISNEYHLNDPFFTQYWLWLTQAVQFHFGNSIQSGLPVSSEILARLPTSLLLGFYAYIVTMVVGVALGIASALRRRSAVDRGLVAGATVGLSMPAFVTAVFAIYLFAIVIHLFPPAGGGSGFFDKLGHLTLPALALAVGTAAFVMKHTRAALIGVVDQDYVTFARARGLSPRLVMFRYALRNSLIPVVSISGIALAFLITGAVLVEQTFSIFGIGSLLVQSATTKDIPTLQGVTLVVAAIIMAANLLADVVYMAVDPRVRVGRRSR